MKVNNVLFPNPSNVKFSYRDRERGDGVCLILSFGMRMFQNIQTNVREGEDHTVNDLVMVIKLLCERSKKMNKFLSYC